MMIVKIGGGAAINHRGIAADLAQVDGPKILVHGANAVRDKLANDLGKPIETVTSLSGYTSVLSDDHTIDTILMAYSGLANKKIVALCREQGLDAVGLTGLDGGLVTGKRNKGIRTQRNGKKMILRDFSGKPHSINTRFLEMLLSGGYTPVLTIPILDELGKPINTENDEIVALLQQSLHADRVIQLIEAPGLLEDPNHPDSLVKTLQHEDLESWESRVEGRMKRKIKALRKLSAHGRPSVWIGDGRVEHPIQQLLAGEGTVIQ